MATIELMVHVPKNIASIITDYLRMFIRPFKKFHCVICATKHTRTEMNLCDEHSRMCLFCFGDCVDCPLKIPLLKQISMPTYQLWERFYQITDDQQVVLEALNFLRLKWAESQEAFPTNSFTEIVLDWLRDEIELAE